MRIAFIWHMHQPFYKDLKTGEYLMPWVRLHGSKDYLDMLLLLDEFPGIRQTFNLVPSLLEQITDYVQNKATDRHLSLSRRKPNELIDEERMELVESFFSAHYPTMIKPYPRYNELYHKCRERSGSSLIHALSEQEILDLQVWSNAAWIDPIFRTDKKIKLIYRKGRDFSEEDKNSLIDFQIQLLSRMIPAYQERRASGKIEVSFSPYYHPILPLLVDTDSARMALPNILLPRKRFSHPEDAEAQVAKSAELYKTIFGADTFGMWPSEGSVSEAILPIVKRHGVKWIATDEEIYYASINNPEMKKPAETSKPTGIHYPYTVGYDENRIGILFRDHRLSDKIGFVYSSWDPEKAANDFVTDLLKLQDTLGKSDNDSLVSIILDGENAWEYFANDGVDFLRLLYGKIEKDKEIQTVLPSEVFADDRRITRLPFLFSGSWINHNFRVWIGHEEDNTAWDLLGTTRDELVEFLKAHPDFDAAQIELAWKEIYIAEGSDWCWWYGDDHQTEQFELFDYLFRRHLQTVWEVMGKEAPLTLMKPLRRLARQIGLAEPTDSVTPIIDGRQTNYFEWFGAGKIECRKMGGAMHRADARLHEIYYGYDDDNLYFRFDPEPETAAKGPLEFALELVCDTRLLLVATREKITMLDQSTPDTFRVEVEIRSGWDKIVELSIPRDVIAVTKDKHLHFSIAVKEKEKIVERWPSANYISLELPNRGETLFWQV